MSYHKPMMTIKKKKKRMEYLLQMKEIVITTDLESGVLPDVEDKAQNS